MNTAYYFGQTGLLLAAFCGIGIIDARSREKLPPPWYYTISVWAISLAATFLWTVLYQAHHRLRIPDMGYWFCLALGLERLMILIAIKTNWKGPRIRPALMLGVNTSMGVLTVLLVLGVFGSMLFNRIADNGEKTEALKNTVEAIAADTTRLTAMQVRIDSLTHQLARKSDHEILLASQLSKATGRIDELTEAIIHLSKSIGKMGASVERSRKSITLPPLDPMRPTKPTGEGLLPERVRLPLPR